HEVFNQPTPLEPRNLYTSDAALQEALHREGGGWAEEQVAAYGALAGDSMMDLGFQANENLPRLRAFDRYGHRVDQVEYHPAYHKLMRLGIEHGLHALPWREPKPGAHVARAALVYLHCQAEAGTQCPITMTFASIPTLRLQPEVAAWWEPRILSLSYDSRFAPPEQKAGLTIGMGMTEKQGGTDVRANQTQAYPVQGSGPGAVYELVGHKWFCSAPMCDAFLVTARTEKGVSCFLLPRWRPDGTPNAFHIQRLKDKLGNRSNASSEVEFAGAYAVMVGEEGRGVRNIIEMVALTRFDCIVGSAALMRQALAQAIHHCAQRQVFGKELIHQPLMANVLADLALESEAALAFAFRVARAMDHA
ncbi:MAG: DNA alkylation response protein, partial [Caldilineae bacterium]